MEEKILRIGSLALIVVVILILSGVYYLPTAKGYVDQRMELAREERERRAERITALESMSGLDFLAFMTEQAEGGSVIHIADITSGLVEVQQEETQGEAEKPETEEALVFSSQLRMELPSRAEFSDITLDEDYVNHLITFTIAKANDEYLIDYPMIGSSDHIKNLSFDNRAEGFVIQFEFEESMECILTQDVENPRYVYVDFLPPRELYERIIVIDAGHGADMAGAVVGSYMEKDINLSIVMKLKEIFDAQEDGRIGVYYTRLEDVDIPFAQRSGLANELDADLFVSIHCNSYSKQESVRGTQVMYDYAEERGGYPSARLAELLLGETLSALGTKDMGIIDGSDIYILRTAEVPAALLEVGFMTNHTELENMLDEAFQQKCAQAVYDALMKALEEAETYGA